MAKDIGDILSGWEYTPDNVSVRIVPGTDGREKIQIRLDLGLLQMEFDGRPDGQRIEGHESWLDYYVSRQKEHDAADPDGAGFQLQSEDCARLLREGMQYYHRYLSFWHLGRYELCARDTARNLRLFSFVKEYARHERDRLQFDQWRPYVTMMHTRAVATPLLELREMGAALGAIDAGIQAIERFLEEYDQGQRSAECAELVQLKHWRDELAAHQPQLPPPPKSGLEQLRADLEAAINDERFEDAARIRDDIRRGEADLPREQPRG